jgi:hypothetical protein
MVVLYLTRKRQGLQRGRKRRACVARNLFRSPENTGARHELRVTEQDGEWGIIEALSPEYHGEDKNPWQRTRGEAVWFANIHRRAWN